MNPLSVLGRPWLAVFLSLAACGRPDVPAPDPRDVIDLRWIKAYDGESRADVETGLLWGLSLLGAQLPRDSEVVRWKGDRVTIDLSRAGVPEGTLPAWRRIVAAMKASGEYRVHGALDAGRFLAIVLGTPDYYYELTQAVPDYLQARQRYRFGGREAAIVRSAVAHGSRRIEIAAADEASQVAFVAFEGAGSLADGSFVEQEMELVDLMPNGQLRFALYGLDGRLKQAATSSLTTAGKPAKCMWCHEANLQPAFIEFAGVPGYYDRRGFDALIAQRQALLRAYRDRLDTRIDYRDAQDHTCMELLYLTFEQPSRDRLAREWGVTPERAAELLLGKPTHAHAEFAFLGADLYHRADVEGLAPYDILPAPASVRELELVR